MGIETLTISTELFKAQPGFWPEGKNAIFDFPSPTLSAGNPGWFPLVPRNFKSCGVLGRKVLFFRFGQLWTVTRYNCRIIRIVKTSANDTAFKWKSAL